MSQLVFRCDEYFVSNMCVCDAYLHCRPRCECDACFHYRLLCVLSQWEGEADCGWSTSSVDDGDDGDDVVVESMMMVVESMMMMATL